MAFVIMKKGGEPGHVAINPDRVTHVRSTGSLFTDIYFGDHHVSVEGSFQQVIHLLSGDQDAATPVAGPVVGKAWIRPR